MKTSQAMPQMPTLEEMTRQLDERNKAYLDNLQEKFRSFHLNLIDEPNLCITDTTINRNIRCDIAMIRSSIPEVKRILNLPACQSIQSLCKRYGWNFEMKESHLPEPNTSLIYAGYELTLTRQLPKTKTLFIFQFYWNGRKIPDNSKLLIIAENLKAAEKLSAKEYNHANGGEGFNGYRCEQQIPLDDDVNLSLIL